MYYYPSETAIHAATWLSWPHEFSYGRRYKKKIEPIWIEMTRHLVGSEIVKIIAYNSVEKRNIERTLLENQIALDRIEFFIVPTNDVWVRDTGPIFVKDSVGRIFIADFAFDGWGAKCACELDNSIPRIISHATGIPILDVSSFVLEGGSIEVEGGICMATRSSVISKNRNPGLSRGDAEYYLNRYLGVTNFIWLDGVLDEDITDAHIDGTARFYDNRSILTVSKSDFREMYKGVVMNDYTVMESARNASGEKYRLIILPLTAKNVKGLNYKGSYLNFYIANSILLMPVYNDENDIVAQKILAELYPAKAIIPINVTALYKFGGMIHCVTQQQPM